MQPINLINFVKNKSCKNSHILFISKIAKQVSVLALSTVSYFFFNQIAVNAGEELLLEENLRGISNLEFKTEYSVECTLGNSLNFYNREALSYLQNKGIPVIADTSQQSYPRLMLVIDCIDGGNIVVYSTQLIIFKIINENGKMSKVMIYDSSTYGAADRYSFNNRQKESVVENLNTFIERWKFYH